MDEKLNSYEKRLKELEFAMGKAVNDFDKIKDNMKLRSTTPHDYAELNNDIERKRKELTDLSTRAETILETIKDETIAKDDFEQVRLAGIENTNRLDKIQKEDKMLNLLFANLPVGLHTIQGFGNFAYNELNVELGPGDIMFISKVFESANRLVHLVRFRSFEVRNAVYRGRTNLGFRSKIWVNEDLIPSKEALALGARRRFRAGKIARNWTFQGEVYIALKNDPTPIKIMNEKDFPVSTALKDGEGMLPREISLRNRGIQSYQGGERNVPQRQTTSQDVRNGDYSVANSRNIRAENQVDQNNRYPNQNQQQPSTSDRNPQTHQGPQIQQQIASQQQLPIVQRDDRQTNMTQQQGPNPHRYPQGLQSPPMHHQAEAQPQTSATYPGNRQMEMPQGAAPYQRW